MGKWSRFNWRTSDHLWSQCVDWLQRRFGSLVSELDALYTSFEDTKFCSWAGIELWGLSHAGQPLGRSVLGFLVLGSVRCFASLGFCTYRAAGGIISRGLTPRSARIHSTMRTTVSRKPMLVWLVWKWSRILRCRVWFSIPEVLPPHMKVREGQHTWPVDADCHAGCWPARCGIVRQCLLQILPACLVRGRTTS